MKAVEKRDLTMCSQRRFERVEAHSVIPPNEAREKNYAGIEEWTTNHSLRNYP
jgi:hypothetical protein